jgi:hypothetical protein
MITTPYTKKVTEEFLKLQGSGIDPKVFQGLTGLTPDDFQKQRPDLGRLGSSDFGKHCQAWHFQQLLRLKQYLAYQSARQETHDLQNNINRMGSSTLDSTASTLVSTPTSEV